MPAISQAQVSEATRDGKEEATTGGGQGASVTRTEMLRRENIEQEQRFRAEQAKLLQEKAELEKRLNESKVTPKKEVEIVRAAPEKKPRSNMLLIGVAAVILLIAAVVGVSVLGGGGNNSPSELPTVKPSVAPAQNQKPASTEKPTQVPTKASAPTATNAAPTNTKAAAPTTAPVVNVEDKIKAAHILVYEDTAAEGLWIEPMLKKVGYATNAKFVHDRIGTLQNELNNPDVKWDLILIAAEARSAVTGELWVDVKEQIDKGTPVVIETWTIHRQVEGKIKDIMNGCGVQLQGMMDTSLPMIWYDPDSPFFNQPNQVSELSKTNRYWSGEAGDFLKLSSGSAATILAGTNSNREDSGLVVSCYDGRLILQTFSNHDYPQAQIAELWQNYVYNLLSNHFSQ
jgi:hypothetical protein